MENASKALIIAAGVLIAIMVVSLLIIAFNQMSEYQKSASSLEKVTQLAQFNDQFTQYARDDLKGSDLISLVNRVVDFNKKDSGAGEINYSQKVTLKITLGQDFVTTYGSGGELKAFTQKPYTKPYLIDASNAGGTFVDIITELRNVEKAATLKAMDVLSSNLETLKLWYQSNGTKGKSMKQLIGKDNIICNYTNSSGSNISVNFDNDFKNGDFSIVEKHREYSEFKIAKFECIAGPTYKDGQVESMEFRFKK